MQEYNALVQHFVVLKVVQKRHWNHVDAARHVYCRAGHAGFGVNLSDELGERVSIPLEFVQQSVPTLPPSPHQEEYDRRDNERKPASLQHFHQVGADEREINHGEQPGGGET
jgi:hypothetical protein